MIIFLLVLGYVLSGVAAHGIAFAHFQREWPALAEQDYHSDMRDSLLLALLGPCALIAILIASGFAKHGIKFK